MAVEALLAGPAGGVLGQVLALRQAGIPASETTQTRGLPAEPGHAWIAATGPLRKIEQAVTPGWTIRLHEVAVGPAVHNN